MLRNNIAGTLSSIGLGAVQKANVVGEDKDLGQAIAKGINDWGDFGRKKALVDAMQSGDMEQVNKAYAAYDPEAYAKQMFANEQSKQEREWQLADNETEFNRKKQLEAIKFANDMELEKEKRKNGTTAQQNMSYLQSLGYTPEEAASLYYSGQNPNMNIAMLGQKGFEAYDKEMGKGLAEMQKRNRIEQESDDRLSAVRKHLQENPSTVGIWAPLQAFAVRLNPNKSEKDQNWLKARGYSSRALGEIQNALIAEAKSAGQSGINTAREIEQAAKGLNENSSLEEVLGALDAMQDSIGRLRKARTNGQTRLEPTNWGEVSDDDLLKGL